MNTFTIMDSEIPLKMLDLYQHTFGSYTKFIMLVEYIGFKIKKKMYKTLDR